MNPIEKNASCSDVKEHPLISELTKSTPIFLKFKNYTVTTTHHKDTNLA